MIDLRAGNHVYIFNASSMTWFGMEGQTSDITILFAGLISLRIWIASLLTVIVEVFSIRESSICLLDRNSQKRLLEILDTYVILLGPIIWPIAIT